MFKVILVLFFIMPLSYAYNYSQSIEEYICTENNWNNYIFDNTKVNFSYSRKQKSCRVAIAADTYPKYRSYNFSTVGSLNIFISYSDGPPSRETAMKSYMLLTGPSALKLIYDKINKTLVVSYSTGMKFTIDTTKGKFLAMTHFNFVEQDEIKKEYKGGLDLFPIKGNILLDVGWRIGASPKVIRRNKSTFLFSNRKKCTVRNKEVFVPYYDSHGVDGVVFKYPNLNDLYKFLRRRCS